MSNRKNIKDLCIKVYEDNDIKGFTTLHVENIKFIFKNENDILTVVFRGTDNIENALTDKDLFDKEIPKVYPLVMSHVLSIINTYKPKKIILGGHSLGGSIVQFLCKILGLVYDDIESYTFNAYGDISEIVTEESIDNSLFNMLDTNAVDCDIKYLIEKIKCILFDKLIECDPIIKISMFELDNIDSIEDLIEKYIELLKENPITYKSNRIKNGGSITLEPEFNLFKNLKIQLGIGDLDKTTYENQDGVKMCYNICLIAYYGALMSLLYTYKLNKDKVDKNINLTNFVIKGDFVGTRRTGTIGKYVYFGDDLLTKVVSNHSIVLFNNYIL